MSFFKIFDWDFFGKKKLEKEVNRLQNEVTNLETQVTTLVQEAVRTQRPFRSAKYANGDITVVLNDGSVLSATRTGEDFANLGYTTSIEEVLVLMSDKPVVETEQDFTQDDKENQKDLLSHEEVVLDILGQDFSCNGKDFHYKGISLPVHPLIINSLVEHKKANNEEGFESVRNFFLKLVSASKQSTRDNIMSYIQKNDVKLTKTGNIIGYRRIVSIPNPSRFEPELVRFTEESRLKLKGWKKGAGKYNVGKDTNNGGYLLLKGTSKPSVNVVNHGTVEWLYNSMVEEKSKPQLYTSYHNKGKHTFYIGDVYRVNDENDVNSDTLCSYGAGIHYANVSYDYSGFGDTPVIVLINPSMNVVVPVSDSGKARTVEMKIAMINPNEPGIHIDEELLEQADAEYNQTTIEQIEQALTSGNLETLSINRHGIDLNENDLQTIRKSLQERVVMI